MVTRQRTNGVNKRLRSGKYSWSGIKRASGAVFDGKVRKSLRSNQTKRSHRHKTSSFFAIPGSTYVVWGLFGGNLGLVVFHPLRHWYVYNVGGHHGLGLFLVHVDVVFGSFGGNHGLENVRQEASRTSPGGAENGIKKCVGGPGGEIRPI